MWLCAVLLSQTAPAIAPALAPAIAPAPAAPLCLGGIPGAWQCGTGNSSLLFDEATHQQLLSTYPGQCTALTADALLCSGVLLTADAQSALSAGTCTCVLIHPPALSLDVMASALLCRLSCTQRVDSHEPTERHHDACAGMCATRRNPALLWLRPCSLPLRLFRLQWSASLSVQWACLR